MVVYNWLVWYQPPKKLDSEFAQAEKLIQMYAGPGNAPMAAKQELRLKELACKKSKIA